MNFIVYWKYVIYIACMIDNEIYLYMMLTMNLLILFYVWIEVRRVKRSQFDAVWMMLKHCMIRKVIMQNFHSHDNILSNSHNQSTKKINDMSMSVRDEKISREIIVLSMRVMITSDQRICNSSTASIYWNIFITSTMSLSNWWKDIR